MTIPGVNPALHVEKVTCNFYSILKLDGSNINKNIAYFRIYCKSYPRCAIYIGKNTYNKITAQTNNSEGIRALPEKMPGVVGGGSYFQTLFPAKDFSTRKNYTDHGFLNIHIHHCFCFFKYGPHIYNDYVFYYPTYTDFSKGPNQQ